LSAYLIRRLLIAVPIFFGVTVFNFFIIHLAPGDPVDIYVDPFTSQEDIARKKEQLGLHEPLWVQYINWLSHLLRGDFGFSFSTFEPVIDLISVRVWPTLLLMGTALLLAYAIAIPIGILSAVKQYSKLDFLATGVSFLGVSIPNFFLGLSL
jgi:peptide/nickel transport system permease protein